MDDKINVNTRKEHPQKKKKAARAETELTIELALPFYDLNCNSGSKFWVQHVTLYSYNGKITIQGWGNDLMIKALAVFEDQNLDPRNPCK